jgi:hypothetical protein
MPTPSQYGLVFGTSTTSPDQEAPGGANIGLENVAIYLEFDTDSVPLYYVAGAGLSHFYNLWTLGDWGVYITRDNELGFSSDYADVGPAIGIAGLHGAACNLLGYGGGPVLVIQGSHNMVWDQLYTATIFGGPAYAGQPYALNVDESTGVEITIENDYFPSVLITEGAIENFSIRGTSFPHATPIPSGVPLVAFFNAGYVIDSEFMVKAVLSAPVTNFHYTSNGIAANMTQFNNCRLLHRTHNSTNTAFLNVTAAIGKPFFNLRFDGNDDTGVFDLRVNQVPAGAGTMRYWDNGVLVGSG